MYVPFTFSGVEGTIPSKHEMGEVLVRPSEGNRELLRVSHKVAPSDSLVRITRREGGAGSASKS